MRSKERKKCFHTFNLLYSFLEPDFIHYSLYKYLFKIINKETIKKPVNVAPVWLWLRLAWLRTKNEISV